MRTLYIPIFSNSVQAQRFSILKGNPGVGGTEFTSIILALTLASAKLNWQIVLVHSQHIILDDCPLAIQQEIFSDVSAFLHALKSRPSAIVLAPALILIKANIGLIKQVENKILCWSHHPFDVEAQILNSKIAFRGIVCVGTYQFHSNTNLRSTIYHIQNLFYLPELLKNETFRTLNRQRLNILFLGALTLGKGFSEIAKSWKALKQRFPGVRLHVIGSSATYGWQPESELIPTSKKYASKILKFIPKEDIDQGEVIFYGNLGIEKWDIMSQCDVALLNPIGKTEAFPASVLECMGCGIPVIASDDYGMSDSMRFFPELVIKGHQNIVDRVEWLISDPSRHKEIKQRSLDIAQQFSSQSDQIVTRWCDLLEEISEDVSRDISGISDISGTSKASFELPPTLPFVGSKKRLRRRQFLQRYFIFKRRLSLYRDSQHQAKLSKASILKHVSILVMLGAYFLIF